MHASLVLEVDRNAGVVSPLCSQQYTCAMDLDKMLAELRVERDAINEAIAVLTRIAEARKRRGRPAPWTVRVKPRGSNSNPKNGPV